MRLINTSTRYIHEFFDSRVPKYAILSHCWGDKEVSFEDYKPESCHGAAGGSGYQKIAQACQFAYDRGLEWMWIDTCCIDKRSSAELSEAINSMFNWYERAVECYAHLADVPFSEDISTLSNSLQVSKWFTRGWTLQELIAPSRILFVTKDWKVIGCKVLDQEDGSTSPSESEHGTISLGVGSHHDFFSDLVPQLSDITNIPEAVLREKDRLQACSIAMRMSWIARRETTRQEDLVYCLLGLFDINMAPLYGEGLLKAFTRLQREIIALSDDESIFAWSVRGSTRSLCWPVLADSPYYFSRCGTVYATREATRKYRRSPYRVANQGLEIKLGGSPDPGVFVHKEDPHRLLMFLNSDRVLRCDDGIKIIPDAVELLSLGCGHYGRVIGETGDLETLVEGPDLTFWTPIDKDLTCYFHTFDSKLACG